MPFFTTLQKLPEIHTSEYPLEKTVCTVVKTNNPLLKISGKKTHLISASAPCSPVEKRRHHLDKNQPYQLAA